MKNLQSPEKQSGFEDLAVTCLSDWGSSSSNVTQIIEKEVTKKSNPGVLTYWADDCRRPNQTAPWHAFQQLRQETDRQLTSTTDTTTLTATWRSNLFKYRMGTHSDSARQSKHSRGGREGYHRCRVLDPVRIRALRRTFAELRLKCQWQSCRLRVVVSYRVGQFCQSCTTLSYRINICAVFNERALKEPDHRIAQRGAIFFIATNGPGGQSHRFFSLDLQGVRSHQGVCSGFKK